MTIAQAIVRRRKVAGVLKGDPWIHVNAVMQQPDQPGLCQVVSDNGSVLGVADWNPGASIRGRLLHRSGDWPGEEAWLSEKLAAAIDRRMRLGFSLQGGAVRLVNGEGDGLPGLVIDLFGRSLVVDLTTAGMRQRLEIIEQILDEQLGDCVRAIRMSEDAARREGVDPLPVTNEADIRFSENAVTYQMPLSGQKTGFYLDQRDNRRMAAQWASGRRVLDLFCYQGGFALASLAAGAAEALAIDSSAPALDAALEHATRNGFQLSTAKGDVFKLLDELIGEATFDLIICDPPKLAPRRRDHGKAMGAYRYLLERCVKLLEVGGILLTSSCSSAIGNEDLRLCLERVAAKQQKHLDVLATTTHPSDHPWPVAFCDGRYLSTIAVEYRSAW